MRKIAKKGFTLVELIFVIVIIAVLVGLFYPTIMANKDKANIGAVVGNDAKLIASAVTQWKGSSKESDGSYTNLTTDSISIYLPNSMVYDSVNHVVKSSGLNSGISYQVLSDKITQNGDSFKIYIDFSKAIGDHSYNTRLIQYAEKTAEDAFYNLSTDKGNTSETGTATALGSANSNFTAGGTTSDGKAGTRNVVF